jgi:hypothetical protein
VLTEGVMSPGALKPDFEIVHTVNNYYDGPRSGIADYDGSPHFYDCIFDEQKDDYSDSFLLTPIDPETFKLAMEDWEIWRRWEVAFHSGKADLSTHPCLPQDCKRHHELKPILDRNLVTDPKIAITRVGKFEAIGTSQLPKGVLRRLQVKWELS